MEENKTYIERCFKEKNKLYNYLYYKVILAEASDTDSVTVLTFPEEIKCWRGEGDKFVVRLIEVYEISLGKLKEMNEISLDEYNLAMDKFYNSLINKEEW